MIWLYPLADASDPRFSALWRYSTGAIVLLVILIWPINKWVSMFVGFAYFSSIIPFSTKQSTAAWEATLTGCIWFYAVYQFIKTDQHISWTMDAICIVALCSVGLLICQNFGFDPIFKPKVGSKIPVVGFLSNRNEASAFLAISLPAFFRGKWKWFVPLVFLGLAISRSTGGVLAVIAMLPFYFVLKDGSYNVFSKWTINVILFVLALVFFNIFVLYVDPTEWLHNTRFKAWAQALILFKQHWLFGAGLGHWKVVSKEILYDGKWFGHVYNEYLQSLFEMGILVIPLFVGYFVGLVKKYSKETILSTAAIIVASVNSTVNFPMHIAQTACLITTWMVIFEKQSKHENKKLSITIDGNFTGDEAYLKKLTRRLNRYDI